MRIEDYTADIQAKLIRSQAKARDREEAEALKAAEANLWEGNRADLRELFCECIGEASNSTTDAAVDAYLDRDPRLLGIVLMGMLDAHTRRLAKVEQ